jgi:uncharacterized protein (DUF1800 family)
MRAHLLLATIAPVACQAGPQVRPTLLAAAPDAAPEAIGRSELSPVERADQVLDRLAFGPRPDEVEALVQGGDAAIWTWIESQLSPEAIDDAAVERLLAVLPTLRLSNAELYREYPSLNEVAKARGVDLGNEDQKRQLQNQLDPDQLARRIDEDLEAQKLLRAVESRRQLEEVLTDFWFNHFNVDIEKGKLRWLITSYERDSIRPHLWGRFRDLLGAVAHSPAMLFYLDNFQSVRERAANPRKPGAAPQGLNENYARELMELHTLGVAGGYTQADVREAARCLTGWSIGKADQEDSGTFVFRPRAHDEGEKVVLGHSFPAGQGEADGDQLLDLLASLPQTAHFLAFELARHFISDQPPEPLVERLAQRYLATDGDLRQVYLALFSSPEFWSRQAYRSKVKSPFEVAVSGVRALDGHLDVAGPLADEIRRMGEPLYKCQPPTGYPDVAASWVNSGALVERLNFGLRLASGKVGGVHGHLLPFVPGRRRADPSAFIDLAAQSLIGGRLTPETRAVLVRELGPSERTMPDGEIRLLDVAKLAGLLLGSPEFQRR